MHTNDSFNSISNYKVSSMLFTIILASVLLSGCDNNDKSSKTILSVNTTVRTYDQDATLRGAVSNEEGPVTAGKILVTNDKGGIIVTSQLQNSNRYSIVIPAGTSLPILLKVKPETEQSVNKTLQVAVIDPILKKYDINPLTTAIAKKAKAMGGYTYTNLKQAAMTSTSTPDANKTTGGFRGDPTKQYGGWH